MKSSKTKIVATVGPSSSSGSTIRKLIRAGVSVFRLNFSHGSRQEHEDSLNRIISASNEEKTPVSILQDLCGPKIRLNPLDRPIPVSRGDLVDIKLGDDETRTILSCSYPDFYHFISTGDILKIDDGRISFRVLSKTPTLVHCKVLTSGIVLSRKGINLPGSAQRILPFTEKDEQDFLWGLKNEVDWIALSFVEQAEDINPLRKIMEEVGVEKPVIAKIERKRAIQNMDRIIDAFDGIMVARGDLGVEISVEEVPMLQKKLIRAASRKNRLVITATQMLESMIGSPTPTRAESTDIANAIIDGTDLIMLSAETAAGKFPVKSVSTMSKIARFTERNMRSLDLPVYGKQDHLSHTEALVKQAAQIAVDLDAAGIMLFSLSGQTALLLSKYHPPCPVYAFSPNRQAVRRMTAYRGISPFWTPFVEHTDEMMKRGEEALIQGGKVKTGDLMVTIAGMTMMRGATNMLRLSVINSG